MFLCRRKSLGFNPPRLGWRFRKTCVRWPPSQWQFHLKVLNLLGTLCTPCRKLSSYAENPWSWLMIDAGFFLIQEAVTRTTLEENLPELKRYDYSWQNWPPFWTAWRVLVGKLYFPASCSLLLFYFSTANRQLEGCAGHDSRRWSIFYRSHK